MGERKCHICNKAGHPARQCPNNNSGKLTITGQERQRFAIADRPQAFLCVTDEEGITERRKKPSPVGLRTDSDTPADKPSEPSGKQGGSGAPAGKPGEPSGKQGDSDASNPPAGAVEEPSDDEASDGSAGWIILFIILLLIITVVVYKVYGKDCL